MKSVFSLRESVWLLSFLIVMGGLGCQPESSQPAGPSLRVVTEMNRGVSLMGQYLYGDAVKAFEDVLKDAPELTEARINLAIALFNRNRQEDLAAAEKTLKEVLTKEPANVRALYFQAIVLQHIGKAEEAIPCLTTVLKERPEDGAAWYLLAVCKQRAGQPADAEFLKAVEYRPYLFSAYYQLYQAAMRGGRDDEAKNHLERFKALRESPLGESLEFPQYNQMGDLALAMPAIARPGPAISKSQSRFGARQVAFQWREPQTAAPGAAGPVGPALAGVAAADLNQDGLADLIVPLGSTGRLALLKGGNDGFADATASSGLESLTNAVSCSIGDYDNDEQPDLCVVCASGPRLFRGLGNGKFSEGPLLLNPGGNSAASVSALFLDADHDGDLDLFVCGRDANQLWNNNGNGVFTNIATQAKTACPKGGSVQVLAGDMDRDRDLDLITLSDNGPVRVFTNELLGHYREVEGQSGEMRGDLGGALQDFNGDGLLDLALLGDSPPRLQVWFGDGHGRFRPNGAVAELSGTIQTWGTLRGLRVADVDLDGDLDLVCVGAQGHLLLNDGQGRFVLQSIIGNKAPEDSLQGFEMLDVTGDLVPDLIAVEKGPTSQVVVSRGELVPPSTALALLPNGVRSRDGRTRSPASGYGLKATARAGLREQTLVYTGQSGGPNQSLLPLVLGLGGAAKADYVQLAWPDGVAQVEMGLNAGQAHKVAELQRKISSCPVLFAWNGSRFGFITDFAGVGGLGYYQAPGVSAAPQVLEHVKLEPGQLQPRNGAYELRVAEPMEESAYIDRLELLAVDHAEGAAVFPDERLAVTGPQPTHQLFVVERPIFASQGLDPSGRDCTENLAHVDRVYAYEPKLDRRYVGFCQPHTLELDFQERLASLDTGRPVYLFVRGYIEYPYSQTVYAASQSKVGWEAIRVDSQDSAGAWQTIVADGGAPGGMDRMMTIELGPRLSRNTRKLRLTTNLEIFYDQVFVAQPAGTDRVSVRQVPLREATLRYLGFPREYSPDGRLPLIYDYDLCDATAPFHRLKGAYTRYGAVEPLLRDFDDQYALLGPGDELALKFDATALPLPASGTVRSFILVSHAYCKDMDLYTATPTTLEPLPFKGMSRYPYPQTERYPVTEAHLRFQNTYNTRLVE